MASVDEQVLAELREIKRLLTPAPPAPPTAPRGLIQEFKAFLSQYKVLGLAVAFILGVYLGALVKALVTDLILPIISIFLPPGQDFNTYEVGTFRVGDFANALLTFMIVAFVIFLIVRVSKRYKIE